MGCFVRFNLVHDQVCGQYAHIFDPQQIVPRHTDQLRDVLDACGAQAVDGANREREVTDRRVLVERFAFRIDSDLRRRDLLQLQYFNFIRADQTEFSAAVSDTVDHRAYLIHRFRAKIACALQLLPGTGEELFNGIDSHTPQSVVRTGGYAKLVNGVFLCYVLHENPLLFHNSLLLIIISHS